MPSAPDFSFVAAGIALECHSAGGGAHDGCILSIARCTWPWRPAGPQLPAPVGRPSACASAWVEAGLAARARAPAGHVLPGCVFIIWGAWWAYNVITYHLWRGARRPYRGRAWYPMGVRALWYLEPALKILVPVVGVSMELLLDHDPMEFRCGGSAPGFFWGGGRSVRHNATQSCRSCLPGCSCLPAQLRRMHQRGPCPRASLTCCAGTCTAQRAPSTPVALRCRTCERWCCEGRLLLLQRGRSVPFCPRTTGSLSCRPQASPLAINWLQEQLAAHRLLPHVCALWPDRHCRPLCGAARGRLPGRGGPCFCRHGLSDGHPREARSAGEGPRGRRGRRAWCPQRKARTAGQRSRPPGLSSPGSRRALLVHALPWHTLVVLTRSVMQPAILGPCRRRTRWCTGCCL